MATTVCELQCITYLLQDLKIHVPRLLSLFCDNKAASKDQLADLLTKALPPSLFQLLVSKIGMVTTKDVGQNEKEIAKLNSRGDEAQSGMSKLELDPSKLSYLVLSAFARVEEALKDGCKIDQGITPNIISNNLSFQSTKSVVTVEKKPTARQQKQLTCPRCNSTNTKFCYYNNYSLTQPRYFCKSCRRYWTEAGSLKNVPVGRDSRRNKRLPTTIPSTSSSPVATTASSSPSVSSFLLPDDLKPPTLISQFNTTSHVGDGSNRRELNLGFPSTLHQESNRGNILIIHLFNSKDLVKQLYSLGGI